jgi:hypothetical protein
VIILPIYLFLFVICYGLVKTLYVCLVIFKIVIRVNLETCDELRSGMPESGQKLFMSPQQSGAYGFIDKVTFALISSMYCTSRILKFFSITWIEKKLRCGSMKFWYESECGSGSADPYLCLMDLGPNSDPDPAIFVSDLQDINKKLLFFTYYFLKVYLHHFSKIKSHKEVTKQ